MDDHPASRRDEPWTISGNLVDPLRRSIRPATLTIADGRIASIADDSRPHATWLLPGFVDAHVHVESSLLPPTEFARLAVAHGTVATVSDPHEIANVLGIPGVEFMLDDARQSPFTFHFGAPSCVPATPFDHAGAVIDAAGVAALLDRPEIGYLSEMMNYPGVIAGDREVLAKIAAAKACTSSGESGLVFSGRIWSPTRSALSRLPSAGSAVTRWTFDASALSNGTSPRHDQ
jgi:adenine deaminase